MSKTHMACGADFDIRIGDPWPDTRPGRELMPREKPAQELVRVENFGREVAEAHGLEGMDLRK